MYLKSLSLQNIKCFGDLNIQFRKAPYLSRKYLPDIRRLFEEDFVPDETRFLNWNVVLGDNGYGKSTLAQTIALCLSDKDVALMFLGAGEALGRWVRNNDHTWATLSVDLVREEDDLVIGKPNERQRQGMTRQLKIFNPPLELQKAILQSATASAIWAKPQLFEPLENLGDPQDDTLTIFGDNVSLMDDVNYLKKNMFSTAESRGWIACGYGPFRRTKEGRPVSSGHMLKWENRFASLMKRDGYLAFIDPENWLRDLEYKSLRDSQQKAILDEIIEILKALLPGMSEVSISSEGVSIGRSNPKFDFSDGYDSMYSLATDLLWWIYTLRSDTDRSLREQSGVVIIDEIDAHLHPKWQAKVGVYFTHAFPNLQFIVTTHSPYVALSAGEKALSILQQDVGVNDVDVVKPNANIKGVYAQQSDVPVIRGWQIGDVLTRIFDVESLRDPIVTSKLRTFQELQFGGAKLTKPQQTQLKRLEKELDEILFGNSDAPHYQKIDRAVEAFKKANPQK